MPKSSFQWGEAEKCKKYEGVATICEFGESLRSWDCDTSTLRVRSQHVVVLDGDGWIQNWRRIRQQYVAVGLGVQLQDQIWRRLNAFGQNSDAEKQYYGKNGTAEYVRHSKEVGDLVQWGDVHCRKVFNSGVEKSGPDEMERWRTNQQPRVVGRYGNWELP